MNGDTYSIGMLPIYLACNPGPIDLRRLSSPRMKCDFLEWKCGILGGAMGVPRSKEVALTSSSWISGGLANPLSSLR